MDHLSSLAQLLDGQPMFKLLALAKELEASGKKIIHFEIGDPSFSSPKKVINAAKIALDNGKTHYTDSFGVLEFRKAISLYTEKYWGFKPNLSQILVSPANSLIDFSLRCIADPGDEIILPDPCFPTYSSVVKYTGIKPVYVPLKPENEYRMQPNDIASAITSKTKAILINSPHNPTGSVLKKKEIIQIAEIARDKDIFLISDEVYSRIIFHSKHYSPSLLDECKERTLIINSMSKIFAMSGWRMGYAIGPEKLIEKMGLLSQTILSCSSEFSQLGAAEALSTGQDFIDKMNIEYQERMYLLVNGLNNISGITCVKPNGAFYIFPKIDKKFGDIKKYCENLLLEEGVCIVPGEFFGSQGKRSVRMSYSATTKDEIMLSLDKINNFNERHI
jgi:aspartate aminotransferase